ncbi:helix-turn-helix domain-containing protein [Paenibacillus pasadenensis]|uniref:Two-component response regulator yesN n=1 Tax=Paenibacillus pasadenensis TaxID=217090 RepID=A0A2N5N9Z4_9BACL|nr:MULTISPECIES: helix-turn-helix domain-containing protein [Paenibacillus]PLT47177.1 Two-component response regulator yesN [Paenibacillus pasadenensis]QGG57499.1 response regulator [Paenibacillus sp. B01]
MNVLIVDDESHARDAAKLLVDWQGLGFERVLEADNGEAAKMLMDEHNPMLILTDIHMPITDGIRFMEWTSTHHPEAKVIAISGYNDFEYVRKTMKYGGRDYILKPIDPDQLNEAVQRALEEHRSETREKQRQVESGIALNQYKPVYWSHLFGRLLAGSQEAEAAAVQLKAEFSGFPDQAPMQAVLLSLYPIPDKLLRRFRGDRELLDFAIVNVLNDLLRSEWRCGYAFRSSEAPDELIALFWDRFDLLEERVRLLIEAVSMTLKAELHAGIGGKEERASAAWQSVKQARIALSQRNLLTPELRIHRGGIPAAAGAALPNLSALGDALRLSIQVRNAAEATSALGNWFRLVRSHGVVTPASVRAWETQMGVIRSRIEQEYEIDTLRDQELPLVFSDQGRLLLDETEKEWRLLLLDWLDALLRSIRQERSIIDEMSSYIASHLEEDLSLQALASRFFLSREHVSRRFKQETGQTLSEHVESLRMDKARKLLSSSELRVSDVAAQVGYTDEKYFSKVFKKHSGCSPGQYRHRD